jgi:esterase/lipase superfamily enzyme
MDRREIVNDVIDALRSLADALLEVPGGRQQHYTNGLALAKLADQIRAAAEETGWSSPIGQAAGPASRSEEAESLSGRRHQDRWESEFVLRAALRAYRALAAAERADMPASLRPLLSRALVQVKLVARAADDEEKTQYLSRAEPDYGTPRSAASSESPPPVAKRRWPPRAKRSAPRPTPSEADSSDAVGEVFEEREVAPSPKGGAQPKTENAEYLIWYGTNRRPNDPADASQGYSAARDQEVHYGSCRVFIPESHKIGSIGSGWLRRLFSGKDDRLKLLSVDELGALEFWERMASRTRRSKKRTGVVFIHGYNVSFEEAALRAAQLGADLRVKGAMAFFSWPSKGNLLGYGRDGQSIEASEEAIATFLVDFVERSGAEQVHVIAHSMGNRGVLGAVNKIGRIAQGRTGVRFGQFILAAADVDADVFRDECDPYRQMGKRTTLYISAKDLAVEAASWLYDYHRVGFLPPVAVLPGIDTIAVTNIDLTLLGHGYVAEARDVLKDIHALIHRDQSPDRRFGLRPAATPAGDLYWEIHA